VDDFVACIDNLLHDAGSAVGEIVNVSSGESISLKEIIEICKEHLQSKSEVNYGALPYRTNEMMDLRCSMEKYTGITRCSMFNCSVNQRLALMISKI
jgi:nucleoside-diphosphate-sugar epimerase